MIIDVGEGRGAPWFDMLACGISLYCVGVWLFAGADREGRPRRRCTGAGPKAEAGVAGEARVGAEAGVCERGDRPGVAVVEGTTPVGTLAGCGDVVCEGSNNVCGWTEPCGRVFTGLG